MRHDCFLSSHTATDNGLIQERDRAKIPEKYKWDLSQIYPDTAAWKKAKEQFVGELPLISKYKGALASGAGILLECLELLDRLGKDYTRLYCYASMCSDQDTRDAQYLSIEQEMGQVGSDFGARTAFIEPEILLMDRVVIDAFLTAEPRLGIYRHTLHDTLRRKEHTGKEGEEKILADASLIADAPNSIYGIFSNADFPFPEVVMNDGRAVKVDKAAFALYKGAPHREDRRKVFSAYFGAHHQFRRTFGTQLYSEVKKNMFFARARKYNSCLERALDGSNIPVAVYRGLVENVNRHLPTFHRYLRLRKRILGVDQLHYHDLYAPLVPAADVDYPLEDAYANILESLRPLGPAYISAAKRVFTERWVDVYPSEGKRSGAYSNGAVYDIHPYILLNYNGKYDDVSTITHELGHTMHSYLTNANQPYVNSHYSIFVAEVASTLNEALLMDHMLKTVTDDRVRLSLLGEYLDSIRGTVFRQTQFAEFELKIHETAESGESLTGESLGEIYDAINRRYYGHDAAVCIVDDEIKVEWAHIPHFYYNFYVYQYATSFTASAAISEQILAGDNDATRRYLALLSAGGSDYPVQLLQRAGVDMTTSAPFDLTMQKMNRVMDEMEGVLNKMKVG